MKRTIVLVLCLMAAPVLAADKKDSAREKDSASHPAVAGWLDMQRSGAQASSVPQILTPVIQERVVKRYLDSFNAPIPVFFTNESGSASMTSLSR